MVAAMGAINKEKNSMTQERLAGENSEKFDNLWIYGSLGRLRPEENVKRQKVIDYLRKTLDFKDVALRLMEINVAGVINEFMGQQNVDGELNFNTLDLDRYLEFLIRLEKSIDNPNFSPPPIVLPESRELYEWQLKDYLSPSEGFQYSPNPYYSQEELNLASIPTYIQAIIKNAWWGYRWREMGGKCLHGRQIFVEKYFDLKLIRNEEDKIVFTANTQPIYKHEVINKNIKFRKTFLGFQIPGTVKAEAIIQVEPLPRGRMQSQGLDKHALIDLISIAYENPVIKYNEYPPFVQKDIPGGGSWSFGCGGHYCGYGCH